jgi:hypothetical protein
MQNRYNIHFVVSRSVRRIRYTELNILRRSISVSSLQVAVSRGVRVTPTKKVHASDMLLLPNVENYEEF